jgi:RNA polymerase sigma factor (sigma-70 family)
MKNDVEIIEGIRGDKSWALESLYKLNHEWLSHYIKNNNGLDGDEDNVLQEGVMVVYQKIMDNKLVINKGSSLKTYLSAVCKNIWYKELRKRKLLVPIPDYFDYSKDEIESDDRPLTKIEEILKDEYVGIKDECKRIFKLRFWENKKLTEIAELFGEKYESFKVRSSRCEEKLRKIFKEVKIGL